MGNPLMMYGICMDLMEIISVWLTNYIFIFKENIRKHH
jgi:hypothetical protein